MTGGGLVGGRVDGTAEAAGGGKDGAGGRLGPLLLTIELKSGAGCPGASPFGGGGIGRDDEETCFP